MKTAVPWKMNGTTSMMTAFSEVPNPQPQKVWSSAVALIYMLCQVSQPVRGPMRDDDCIDMEDELVEIAETCLLEGATIPSCLSTAVLLPFPLSAAVLAAGPRFAKSDPLCAKRPAHMQWAGGWALTSPWKKTKPKIPAPTKILPCVSSARLV